MQMASSSIIAALWQFGHFFSPGALAVGLVEEKDLDKLTLGDEVVKAAVRSYQTWFKTDLNQFTLRAFEFGGLNRHANVDGDVGPNTIEVLTLPRCGVPDYRHPNAVQEANWPTQCRNEITTSYSMTLKGLTAEQISVGRLVAIKNINEALEVKLTLNIELYPNTLLWTVPEPMQGGILAYHYFPPNNCSGRAKGAFNSNVTWSESLYPATDTHEMLHGIGCNHVNNNQATMYPSITPTSQARKGALHSSDIAEAEKNGYKKRTTPVPGPDPTPPPEEHRLYLSSASPIRIVPQ